MTCDSVSKLIPLYSYAELTPDEEDRVEQHLHECPACTREMDRQTALSAALERHRTDVPAGLLDECRDDLMAAIQGGGGRTERAPKGPWTLFLDAINASFVGMGRFRQPVAALALVAVGFFGAKFSGGGLSVATSPAGVTPETFATVRSIQPNPSGGVQISFDETRRRVISGHMEDPAVQRLLLAAAQEENPAVRVESVGQLALRAGTTGVIRDAMLNSLAHDPNPGVRLRALEGLKSLQSDAVVRKTLLQALRTDENDAVRMQVLDCLMAHRDDSMVGVLQGLVEREDNNSMRRKLEKALKDMNASIGTF